MARRAKKNMAVCGGTTLGLHFVKAKTDLRDDKFLQGVKYPERVRRPQTASTGKVGDLRKYLSDNLKKKLNDVLSANNESTVDELPISEIKRNSYPYHLVGWPNGIEFDPWNLNKGPLEHVKSCVNAIKFEKRVGEGGNIQIDGQVDAVEDRAESGVDAVEDRVDAGDESGDNEEWEDEN